MIIQLWCRHTKKSIRRITQYFDESSLGSVLELSQLKKKGNAIDTIIKKPYESIDSITVAYSLYRYANSKNRYNLTVSEFYAPEQKQGIYREFGVSKERFQNILRTFQENKNGIVKVDLVMGLDNISLREDLTYTEVLKLLLDNNCIMKYSEIIGLQEYFHPVFNIENETFNYWKQFIPNDQFYEVLRKTLSAIDTSEPSLRKSIWIQGTFAQEKVMPLL
jgi:hypothetical protein